MCPPALAYTYEQADDQKKQKAEQYINAWLNSFFDNVSPDDHLFNVMSRASAMAKKNGLTQELLDELL